MSTIEDRTKGVILAALLGALGGGLIAVLVTKAIPKIFGSMMAYMMKNMALRTGEPGAAPSEI